MRKPPAHQLNQLRFNGKFTLDIVGHTRYRLPFGQDRLIPVWIATLDVLQENRGVRLRSASQMSDFFDLPKNGYHYHRIAQGFQHLFDASIFFGTEDQRRKAIIVDAARVRFFVWMHIWYSRDGSENPIGVTDLVQQLGSKE